MPWPSLWLMCVVSVAVWTGGGVVDEFTKADRDDWELEKAQDRYETGRTDWADMHGEHRGPPSLAELIRLQGLLKKAQAERNDQLLKGGVDEWPRFW